jgi:O-antigen/teichoic acid export membrane protein
MACVNISLNWILIPRYGFMGSAAAMVVTQAAGSMLGVSWLRYFGHRLHILNAVVKPAFGSACAALVLSVNPGRYIGMTIPLAILCYAAALVLTGAFTSEDVDLLKRMLGRPARAGAA